LLLYPNVSSLRRKGADDSIWTTPSIYRYDPPSHIIRNRMCPSTQPSRSNHLEAIRRILLCRPIIKRRRIIKRYWKPSIPYPRPPTIYNNRLRRSNPRSNYRKLYCRKLPRLEMVLLDYCYLEWILVFAGGGMYARDFTGEFIEI